MSSSNDFKSVKNASKRAITDRNVPNVLEIFYLKVRILGKMDIAIL